MSHILLRSRFKAAAVTAFFCECGIYFGSCSDDLREPCAGDILDAHREHALAHLVGGENKIGVDVIDPCARLNQLIRRIEAEATAKVEAIVWVDEQTEYQKLIDRLGSSP